MGSSLRARRLTGAGVSEKHRTGLCGALHNSVGRTSGFGGRSYQADFEQLLPTKNRKAGTLLAAQDADSVISRKCEWNSSGARTQD